MNATFGNGAELLIAAFALAAGLPDVVKASVSGSIPGNLLLVLGAAMFFGGLGRERQTFFATGANAKTLMLFVAVAAMVMPAVSDLTVIGSLRESSPALDALSLITALVLLMATAMTALVAETLVGAVEGAAHAMGMTDLFVGFVVVAVVGNAAEHFSAILFARRNQMQLAINIAKDLSVQIALFVAPVLVIMSFLLGTPMNLVFHPFELFGIALAVLAVTFASLDGESNWYEGVLLLALYIIVAVATYFVPAAGAAATAAAGHCPARWSDERYEADYGRVV